MINWIKTKLVIILSILLATSICYIIIGKGIVINKIYNNTSNSSSVSNSMSYAGSMAIGFIGGDTRGQWVIKSKVFNLIELDNSKSKNIDKIIIDFLSTLDPIQYCYAKVIIDNGHSSSYAIYIYYPEIMSVQNIKKGKINSTSTTKSWKE